MTSTTRDLPDTLVSVEWLAEHLGEPDLVVLDCTVMVDFDEQDGMGNLSGRPAFDHGHIPGAGFADLTGGLCDSTSAIDFAVPTPQQFCAAMGALGVGDDTRVVLYDNGMSMWSARVWWMLRWVGFDRAALLDGGMAAWVAAGGEVSTDPHDRAPATLSVAVRPEVIADRDEVFASIDDPSISLIDTLPAELYRGEQTAYARPGHVPGAVNVCAMDLLEESGRFRPLDELAALHDGDRRARTITYCGGGIMASTSAFTLLRLGFDDVAVYTASMQEWAADPDNPMAVESA